MGDHGHGKLELSAKKKALLELLRRRRGHVARETGPRPLGEQEHYPLSPLQRRLWILDQLEPGTPAFNLFSGTQVLGALDVACLRRAFEEMHGRHCVLRANFRRVDLEPRQLIRPVGDAAFVYEDLSDLSRDRRDAAAAERVAAQADEPFELASDPLIRMKVLRLGRDEHLILLCVHQIIGDLTALGIFMRELAVLYESFRTDRAPALPELPIQYIDAAAWYARRAEERLATDLDFWRSRLGAGSPPLELPLDRPRPPIQTFSGGRTPVVIPPTLARSVEELAKGEGATPYMVLLSAWVVLLHRLSGQDDVSVGSPVSGRTRAEVQDLIGFFVNLVVLRVDVSGEPSFRHVLGRVRQLALDVYAHQETPLGTLVDQLHPPVDSSRAPFHQVLFALQNVPNRASSIHGLRFEPLARDDAPSLFDLTLHLHPDDDAVSGWLEYNSDLFDRTTAERWVRHFGMLLEQVVAAPERVVSRIPLLDPEERRRLLRASPGALPAIASDERVLVALPAAWKATGPWETRLAAGTSWADADPAVDLVEEIRRHRPTVLLCTSAGLRALLCEARLLGCDTVGRILVAGPRLPRHLVRAARARLKGVEVVHTFGDARTGPVAFGACSSDTGEVSLRPVPGSCLEVLDDHLEPVPVGVTGTLWAAPLDDRGARVSCDRPAAWRPDGTVALREPFLRLGHYLVQRTVLEEALEDHAPVQEALVAVAEDELVAYYVPAPGTSPDPEELRQLLQERVPTYMVPAALVPMERLPRDADDEIRYDLLPAPELPVRLGDLQDELERRLASSFREVLGTASVGRHDDFFALGGDSLLAIELAERAVAIGYPITAKLLFTRPTVAALARALRSRRPAGLTPNSASS